jgi:hypothetical protein
MVVRREPGSVLFSFSLLERKVLERALNMLLQNYRINPAELDERASAVWYSPAGCLSAGLSAEETSDWIKQLHAVRCGRIAVIEDSLRQLTEHHESPPSLLVKLEQADALMTALNDHRLLIAAHQNIGEAEMNMRTLAALTRLPPRQQTALFEIEFFAYIIDELLHLMAGQA